MVPIYRAEQDGEGTYQKNKDVFRSVQRVLKRKYSLIMFGEGYTDDVFIRSLKPVKKGPARIGFNTMEASNWELDIKVQPIGINYSDPNVVGSDVLLSCGEIIHLKDYKELYEENPAKAILQLTKEIEKGMQANITYIKDKKLADFLEHLLMLSRKGMNVWCYDKKLSLESRFKYSKALANRINAEFKEDDQWANLKEKTQQYFEKLRKNDIHENEVYRYSTSQKKPNIARTLFFTLCWPIMLVGVIHNIIPYLFVKKFVEKKFRRRVFWSGVKTVMGMIVMGLFHLPLIFLFYHYVYPSYWLGFAYYWAVPVITGTIAYEYIRLFKASMKFKKQPDQKLAELAKEREELLGHLKKMEII